MDKIRIIQIHAAVVGASTVLSFNAAKSGSPKRALLTHTAVLVTTTVIARRLLKG